MDTPAKPPETWIAALDRADADLGAGRTRDVEDVMRELEADDASRDRAGR